MGMENLKGINRETPKPFEAANDNESLDSRLLKLEDTLFETFKGKYPDGSNAEGTSAKVNADKDAYQTFLRENPQALQHVLDTKAASTNDFQRQLYELALEVSEGLKPKVELAA